MSRDDSNDDGIDDPAKRDYNTVHNTIIPAHESNNHEKKTEVKKLCRRLKILREVIAYKTDDREFMDQMMLDLSFSEALPVEFSYYQHQQIEHLYRHEERIVQDLGSLGYDASKPMEREREVLESDDPNESVDLGDE